MSAVAGGIVQSADVTALAALTTGRPLVRLIQQVAQSIPNNANTALTFGSGSEDIDTHNYHDPSTNTSRITPLLAGYYEVTCTFWLASSTPSGVNLQVFAGKNGAIQPSGFRLNYTAATATARAVSCTSKLSANGSTDYFEAIGLQATGGAVNSQIGGGINSVLEVEFLRPL